MGRRSAKYLWNSRFSKISIGAQVAQYVLWSVHLKRMSQTLARKHLKAIVSLHDACSSQPEILIYLYMRSMHSQPRRPTNAFRLPVTAWRQPQLDAQWCSTLEFQPLQSTKLRKYFKLSDSESFDFNDWDFLEKTRYLTSLVAIGNLTAVTRWNVRYGRDPGYKYVFSTNRERLF